MPTYDYNCGNTFFEKVVSYSERDNVMCPDGTAAVRVWLTPPSTLFPDEVIKKNEAKGNLLFEKGLDKDIDRKREYKNEAVARERKNAIAEAVREVMV